MAEKPRPGRVVSVRLTQDQYDVISEAAARSGLTSGVYIRMAAVKAAHREKDERK